MKELQKYWGCQLCKNKRNLLSRQKCMTCKTPRQIDKFMYHIEESVYICKVITGVNIPMLSIFVAVDGKENHYKIELPLTQDILGDCVKEVLMDFFYSKELDSNIMKEVMGGLIDNDEITSIEMNQENENETGLNLFDKMMKNASTKAYDPSIGQYIDSSTAHLSPNKEMIKTELSYIGKMMQEKKEMSKIVDIKIERRERELGNNSIFRNDDNVTSPSKVKPDPKIPCALCERLYRTSKLLGRVSFKAVSEWRSNHCAPIAKEDKRFNSIYLHDAVKICLFCTSFFDANFSSSIDETAIHESVGIKIDPAEGPLEMTNKASKRLIAQLCETSQQPPNARPLSAMRQSLNVNHILLKKEMNSDPNSKFLYDPKNKDTKFFDQTPETRTLRDTYTDVVKVKQLLKRGEIEERCAKTRERKRKLWMANVDKSKISPPKAKAKQDNNNDTEKVENKRNDKLRSKTAGNVLSTVKERKELKEKEKETSIRGRGSSDRRRGKSLNRTSSIVSTRSNKSIKSAARSLSSLRSKSATSKRSNCRARSLSRNRKIKRDSKYINSKLLYSPKKKKIVLIKSAIPVQQNRKVERKPLLLMVDKKQKDYKQFKKSSVHSTRSDLVMIELPPLDALTKKKNNGDGNDYKDRKIRELEEKLRIATKSKKQNNNNNRKISGNEEIKRQPKSINKNNTNMVTPISNLVRDKNKKNLTRNKAILIQKASSAYNPSGKAFVSTKYRQDSVVNKSTHASTAIPTAEETADKKAMIELKLKNNKLQKENNRMRRKSLSPKKNDEKSSVKFHVLPKKSAPDKSKKTTGMTEDDGTEKPKNNIQRKSTPLHTQIDFEIAADFSDISDDEDIIEREGDTKKNEIHEIKRFNDDEDEKNDFDVKLETFAANDNDDDDDDDEEEDIPISPFALKLKNIENEKLIKKKATKISQESNTNNNILSVDRDDVGNFSVEEVVEIVHDDDKDNHSFDSDDSNYNPKNVALLASEALVTAIKEIGNNHESTLNLSPGRDTMDQYMFARNKTVQKPENPDKWSPPTQTQDEFNQVFIKNTKDIVNDLFGLDSSIDKECKKKNEQYEPAKNSDDFENFALLAMDKDDKVKATNICEEYVSLTLSQYGESSTEFAKAEVFSSKILISQNLNNDAVSLLNDAVVTLNSNLGSYHPYTVEAKEILVEALTAARTNEIQSESENENENKIGTRTLVKIMSPKYDDASKQKKDVNSIDFVDQKQKIFTNVKVSSSSEKNEAAVVEDAADFNYKNSNVTTDDDEYSINVNYDMLTSKLPPALTSINSDYKKLDDDDDDDDDDDEHKNDIDEPLINLCDEHKNDIDEPLINLCESPVSLKMKNGHGTSSVQIKDNYAAKQSSVSMVDPPVLSKMTDHFIKNGNNSSNTKVSQSQEIQFKSDQLLAVAIGGDDSNSSENNDYENDPFENSKKDVKDGEDAQDNFKITSELYSPREVIKKKQLSNVTSKLHSHIHNARQEEIKVKGIEFISGENHPNSMKMEENILQKKNNMEILDNGNIEKNQTKNNSADQDKDKSFKIEQMQLLSSGMSFQVDRNDAQRRGLKSRESETDNAANNGKMIVLSQGSTALKNTKVLSIDAQQLHGHGDSDDDHDDDLDPQTEQYNKNAMEVTRRLRISRKIKFRE